DSFNNVLEVAIVSNSGEATPNFDTDSFDNITNITFENGDYTSYSFLDGYVSLISVTFESMGVPITDLSNDNIEDLTIELLTPTITLLTVDIAQTGSLNITTGRFGSFALTMDNSDLIVDAPNTDLTLNHDSSSALYTMDVNDLTINSTSITAILLISFVSEDAVLNIDTLESLTRTEFTETNASSIIINTEVTDFAMDFKADTIQINGNLVTNLDLVVDSGNTTISNTTTDLIVDYDGGNITLNQDTLVSLEISGEFTNLNIFSDAFDDLFLDNAILNTVNITSNQINLSVDGLNSTTTELNITNDSIGTLTAFIAADVTLTSSNIGFITLSAQVDNLILNTLNATTINFNPSSTVSTLDIRNGTNVESLLLNDSTIAATRLDTTKTTIEITGTGSATSIDLNGIDVSALTVDHPNATVDFDGAAAILVATLDTNAINISGTALNTVILTALSNADTITIDNNSLLNTFTSNDSNITNLIIDSEAVGITIDAVNAENTNITGDSFINMTVDVGTNPLDINTGKTGTITFDLIADEVDLTSTLTSIILENTSAINTLVTSSSNLETLTTGSASITDIEIENTSGDLTVTGTSITSLSVSDNITNFVANVGLSTVVDFTTTATSAVTISTQTDDLTLTSSGDVTLTSTTLESLTLTLGSNDISLAVTKLALDFTFDGSAGEVDFITTTLNTLTVGASTNVDTIIIANTDIATLDFTPGSVSNLDFTSSLNTLSITGNDLLTTIINDNSLNDLTINNTNPAGEVDITTTENSLDLNGSINEVTVSDNPLVSLNLDDITMNHLTINSNSLNTLNTINISSSLEITTTSNNFNLTTGVPTVTFNGGSSDNLNLTSNFSAAINLTTTVQELTINAINTTFNVSGENLTTITGLVEEINVTESAAALFTYDITGTTIGFSATEATSLELTGVNSMTTLDVNSNNLSSLITNNTTITTLDYDSGDNDTAVTTNAVTINHLSTGTASILFNVGVSTQAYNTNSEDITLSTANLSSTILNYTDTSTPDITFSNFDEVTVNLLSTTGANFDGTIVDLVINGSGLSTVTTTIGSVSASLEITSNTNNFNLTTTAPTVIFNGGTSDNLNFNSTLAGTITLVTTNQEVTINAVNTTFNVTGENLTTINGLVEEINVTESAAALFTYDITGTTVEFNAPEATSLELTGVNSITTLDVTSNNLASLVTNNTTITTLDYNSLDNDTIVTTNAVTVNHLSTGTASILFNVGVSTQTYNTNSEDISLSSGNLSSTILNYTDASTPDITFSTFDEATVNLLSTNGVNFGGTIVDLIINGSGLDTVTTTTLDISNKYTMNGTLIDNLDFVSATMLTNVQEIEVNTLSNTNTGGIITKLDGTTVDLISPIVDQDIYDYFYNDQFTTLTAQEVIDTVRYDAFRNTAIDAAYDEIMLNEYMDHILEATLRNEIDTQTYRTVEDYFQDFLTDLGQTEAAYGVTPSANARAAITATLGQAVLTIEVTALETQVTTSIETDAGIYATTEQGNITFTNS
ncbi:hypothetical protein OAO42_01330, partial [Candidatus Izimaplasma bacterium]|nr:hypothetical protein [Candidatus Izimaplasma bacterium]